MKRYGPKFPWAGFFWEFSLKSAILLLFAYTMLHIIGCGGETSPGDLKSPIENNQILAQTLPNYEKICIDNNEALFPSQYASCLPVFTQTECDSDQIQNKLKLEAKWEEIQNWAESTFAVCVARTSDPNFCMAQQQMELSRRSEWDCQSVVDWL